MEKQGIIESNQKELLKDVLSKANKKEKQDYDAIIEREVAIGCRIKDIQFEMEVLEERDRTNKYPQKMADTYRAPDKTHDEIMGMSNGEFHEWCQQIIREASEFNEEAERRNEEFGKWNAKNRVISNEQFKLIHDSMELKSEFDSLEEKRNGCCFRLRLEVSRV